MPNLYFAKMNINDEIFEVYSGKLKINKLLEKIYLSIDNKITINDEYGARIKFFDIDKFDDNSVISGRLGYIKKGVHSSYDPENDTAIDKEDNNKLDYITFYFDVHKEILAYTVNLQLNKNKVLDFFSQLIKKSTDLGVHFILETNLDKLKDELKKVKILKKVSLKLVPPNGDKNDFANLFSLDSDNLQEGNATQIKQEYSTRKHDGLVKDSKLINKLIEGIGLGYAEGDFEGLDNNGEPVQIKTKNDTPFYKKIKLGQNRTKSIVNEKASDGIDYILVLKTRLRNEQ